MQAQNLFLTNRQLRDLNPLIAGEQVCDPGHSIRSTIRKYNLIHYVYRGKGTLHIRGEVYTVLPGQAFLLRPGERASYAADEQDPWHYCWIGFDGSLALGFSELPPVFDLPQAVFADFSQLAQDPSVTEYRLAAKLLQIYALLFSGNTSSNRHVRQVENYIRLSYMHPIRVENIANQLNLDRRYLSRLFKKETGVSIQEYLLTVRLKEADHYLRQGYSVKESAFLAGYEDVSNFSKMYKRHYGQSPAHRRK